MNTSMVRSIDDRGVPTTKYIYYFPAPVPLKHGRSARLGTELCLELLLAKGRPVTTHLEGLGQAVFRRLGF